jgi:hypothetical protein
LASPGGFYASFRVEECYYDSAPVPIPFGPRFAPTSGCGALSRLRDGDGSRMMCVWHRLRPRTSPSMTSAG